MRLAYQLLVPRHEAAVDPILEPPGPAAVRDDPLVVEQGAAVSGVQDGEELLLGLVPRGSPSLDRRLQALPEDRRFPYRVDARLGSLRVTRQRSAIPHGKDVGIGDR